MSTLRTNGPSYGRKRMGDGWANIGPQWPAIDDPTPVVVLREIDAAEAAARLEAEQLAATRLAAWLASREARKLA